MKKINLAIGITMTLIAHTLNSQAFATELSGQVKNYIDVPFKAWNEITNYKKSNNNSINIQVHSSTVFDENSKTLFVRGIRSTLNQFSEVFDTGATIHVVLATNLADATSFVKKINLILPGYEHYNQRHLSQAKDAFSGNSTSFAGGTSSRGCWFQGSPYGDNGNNVEPCPKLNGGVVYWFDPNPARVYWAESIGSHEVSHIAISKLNAMSHFRVPDWIIEGTMQAIGLATVTNKLNLKSEGTLINPIPKWQQTGKKYDLGTLDSQNSNEDRFTIGTLAVSFLLSEFGADKYFDFISKVGYPNNWKDVFLKSFGYSVEDFYIKFSDFHEWYYYKGGSRMILNTNYLSDISKGLGSKTITCIKGKTTKKVRGVTPKCPKGFKKK